MISLLTSNTWAVGDLAVSNAGSSQQGPNDGKVFYVKRYKSQSAERRGIAAPCMAFRSCDDTGQFFPSLFCPVSK
jgi:hypothetical protein